ncbi:hypothetical protein ABTZ03_07675 [Kitasatospora sp. NPDC096077]|uniref:hypothetical protein n=1 Tax=Kitasatospora sp. NPDC096077 TaxID=3155544 RepID=UPI0033345447
MKLRQGWSRGTRRAVGAALAAFLGAVPLVVLPAGPAAADPGFCGVRVDGPTIVPGVALYAYRVRNKCGDAHAFKVYFPEIGRSTFCETIDPYESYSYTYMGETTWWEVRNC